VVPVLVREPPAVEVRLEGLDDGILDAVDVRRLVGMLAGKVWLWFGT
jgi:hypothetical protein